MSNPYQRSKCAPTKYQTQSTKARIEEDYEDCRIIKKNLVYIVGLSASLASKEKLIKYEYLGQYGTIQKIIVNKAKAYNQGSPNGPTYAAYVTYSKPSEASIAILSLDEIFIDGHNIKASFGTTKYCTFFLKGIECTNRDCAFHHKWADEADIIKRKEININKCISNKQHEYAINLADIYNKDVKKKLMSLKKTKTIFPAPNMIYRNIYVIENDPEYKKNTNKKKVESKVTESNKTTLTPSKSSLNINNPISSIPGKSNLHLLFEDTKKPNIRPKVNSNQPKTTLNLEKKEEKKKADLNDLIKRKEQRLGANFTDSTRSSFSKEDFLCKDCSRFDFVKTIPEETNDTVPNEIQTFIQKKMNLFSLNKYIPSTYIDKYLKEEVLKSKDKVKENKLYEYFSYTEPHTTVKKKTQKEKEREPEYISDFNDINDFIIQICDTDYKETTK
ncbi:MAG: hypothetical protein MJ252_25110 [archaeon]|nr:hypothetical protein [archaeon]